MSAEDLAKHDYTTASLPCDVVMKGGITSGVVYPLAVCELAREFRFRNVGGTSAGAIAAAATAAAEYDRDDGGFNKLAGLPKWISGHLPELFQPQEKTFDLFTMLLAGVSPGSFFDKCRWVLSAAVAGYPWAALLGLSPGLVLTVLGIVDWTGGASWLSGVAIALGLLLALIGFALALVARIAWVALTAIPKNGYGMCSGFAPEDRPGAEPLTTWLHHQINCYAGLGREDVLTFGDLRKGPPGAEPRKDREPFLRLAMMTTNLTNRTAHRLPLDPEDWYFDEYEFRRLFPKAVVDRMLLNIGEEAQVPPRRDGPGRLWPWPAADDLPVIVATRMSLSFPVLLSAIPLWRVDEDLATFTGVREAERCWFSDGGISSNFPVHFFDGILPRWPTFAINLRPFPLGDEQESPRQSDNVVMVKDEDDPLREWWYREPRGRFAKLPGFLSGIGKTMQNRADEAQMRVPGYRDRVVHVQLTKTEGGMNLAMDKDVIDHLVDRGRVAADLLLGAYGPDAPAGSGISWLGHRKTRLRSSLAVLETMMRTTDHGYCYERPAGEPTYEALVKSVYDSEAKGLANGLIAEAHRLAGPDPEAGDETLAASAPTPAPEGRIVPRDGGMSEPRSGNS
ncbi:MAG: SuhR protein [Thermoleophilaceae bacterium]